MRPLKIHEFSIHLAQIYYSESIFKDYTHVIRGLTFSKELTCSYCLQLNSTSSPCCHYSGDYDRQKCRNAISVFWENYFAKLFLYTILDSDFIYFMYIKFKYEKKILVVNFLQTTTSFVALYGFSATCILKHFWFYSRARTLFSKRWVWNKEDLQKKSLVSMVPDL